MGKVAWIFPGQGSQYVGMGRELCKRYSDARRTFEEAEHTLGTDLTRIVLEGPETTLKETRNAQPAIFTLSVALARILFSFGKAPAMVAGHSLGEYSALVAGGAIEFENGLRLVRDRAECMQEACERHPGMMCAIMGLDIEEVQNICSEISNGIVDIANINSPGQVIVSGEFDAVRAASEAAKGRGARKAIPLKVSGAFHSRLMESAAERFAPSVSAADISSSGRAFFPNVTAFLTVDAESIRDGLRKQICSPVRWQSTIERMIEEGADTFVEVGPGNVLTGLLKRINSSTVGFNVDEPDSVETVLQAL